MESVCYRPSPRVRRANSCSPFWLASLIPLLPASNTTADAQVIIASPAQGGVMVAGSQPYLVTGPAAMMLVWRTVDEGIRAIRIGGEA